MINDNEKKNLPMVKIYSESPLKFFGGGERLIIMIYKSLKENGIEAKVVENNNNKVESRVGDKDILEELGEDLLSERFRRYGFPRFIYQDFPDLQELKSSSSSIFLIFLRRLPPKSILSQFSTFPKTKVVFCLHGVALEKLRLTDPRIMIHQLIIRRQLSVFAPFVKINIYAQCLIPNIGNYLQFKGANKNNIFIIENEIESGITNIIRNDSLFQVIFIGRMSNLSKGINFLRKVIKKVGKIDSSIKFIVIGSGPDVHILDGLNENCTVLTNADDAVKKGILMSSNLATITSNLEPFSLVAVEFLTSGLPVVTTPASGPSYIVGKDNIFGKISSFSVNSFSEEIILYHKMWKSDKDAYYKMRKNIAEKARSIFDEKRMPDSYLRMIVEVGSSWWE